MQGNFHAKASVYPPGTSPQLLSHVGHEHPVVMLVYDVVQSEEFPTVALEPVHSLLPAFRVVFTMGLAFGTNVGRR